MRGIIFHELRSFVDARGGTWATILKNVGLDGRQYLPTSSYPDAELAKLVHEIGKLSGDGAIQTLEQFGRFIVPDLLKLYGALLDSSWRTLDVLEHTEGVIHAAVRAQDPGASPPFLKTTRTSPRQVVILYSSPRRLCALARGIVAGVADAFKERVLVLETACMEAGAAACEIRVLLS